MATLQDLLDCIDDPEDDSTRTSELVQELTALATDRWCRVFQLRCKRS